MLGQHKDLYIHDYDLDSFLGDQCQSPFCPAHDVQVQAMALQKAQAVETEILQTVFLLVWLATFWAAFYASWQPPGTMVMAGTANMV